MWCRGRVRTGALLAAACLVAAACGTELTPTADPPPTTTTGDTHHDAPRDTPYGIRDTVDHGPTDAHRSVGELRVQDGSIGVIDVPAVADGSAEPTAPRQRPRVVTAAFMGDVLTHSPLWTQAERNAEPGRAPDGRPPFDFRPMYAELKPLIDDADLAVCHLETPIAPVGEAYTTSPLYGVPAEVADALAWSGHDRCSTASNHTMDRGAGGIDRTVAVLESVGIAQSGMARHPGEILPRTFVVNDVTISHLSYTFGYNGLPAPAGQPWRSARIDPVRIVADARTARAIGADVVVVSLHWGTEGVTAPNSFQREVAEAVTAPGVIDLVVGHHAHVLQPIEYINDTWVAFGLGNIISNLPTSARWPRASQDAAVLRLTFEVNPQGRVFVGTPRIHPTWVDKDRGWVISDVFRELARPDLPAERRRILQNSLDRTAAVLGPFLAP